MVKKSKFNITRIKHTKKNIKREDNMVYFFDIEYIKNFKLSNIRVFQKKINKQLDAILLEPVDDYSIECFINKINSEIIIDYAKREVPDILALPKKIGEESKLSNIYQSYQKSDQKLKQVSREILVNIIAQRRIHLLFQQISHELNKNINLTKSFSETVKDIVIKKISKINNNLGYWHLKYLLYV
jgi:hypothetical protein